MTNAVTLAQYGGVSPTFRNRIINGAMVIDQRNAGASGTASGYTIDRWVFGATLTTKGTWQQNAGSVTPPTGFTNYWGFTSNSAYSVSSSDIFSFYQVIEGYNISDLAWGTANAKTITVSAWVRSSLTGTFGGSIENQGVARSYPFSYTISAANTWTQISVTIPGDQSGTWNTTNLQGLYLFFSLGGGSTYSGTAGAWVSGDYRTTTGATSVVGTSGATFYITGVQLEVGSSATGFEYRQYGQELALCQRYYSKQPSTTSGTAFGAGIAISGTQADVYVKLTTSMRAAPTSTTSGCVIEFGTANSVSVSSIANANTGTDSAFLRLTGSAASLTAGQAVTYFGASTSAYVDFSAEL